MRPPQPYYKNKYGKIYHGNCEEILSWIPDETVDLVVMDPPYGVDYVGKTDDALTIQNDGADDLRTLLRITFNAIIRVTKPGAAWYVTAPAGPQFLDFAIVLTELEVWRQTLVWVKDSMVLGHSDYHYRHEAIFYGWTPGAAHHAIPTRDQTTIWECDRPKRSSLHPTMKPVDLFKRMILNSTHPDGMVLDPFLGSGTTARAAMLCERRFIGIEIAEEYCNAPKLLCEQTRTGLTPGEQTEGQQMLFED